MLHRFISLFISFITPEPTQSKGWGWKMATCDTCHKPLLAPDGSYQRFPDSQQIIGNLCESGHGCRPSLLSPYYYDHTHLMDPHHTGSSMANGTSWSLWDRTLYTHAG